MPITHNRTLRRCRTDDVLHKPMYVKRPENGRKIGVNMYQKPSHIEFPVSIVRVEVCWVSAPNVIFRKILHRKTFMLSFAHGHKKNHRTVLI